MFGLVFKYFPPFPQVCALRLLVSILASLDFNGPETKRRTKWQSWLSSESPDLSPSKVSWIHASPATAYLTPGCALRAAERVHIASTRGLALTLSKVSPSNHLLFLTTTLLKPFENACKAQRGTLLSARHRRNVQ